MAPWQTDWLAGIVVVLAAIVIEAVADSLSAYAVALPAPGVAPAV